MILNSGNAYLFKRLVGGSKNNSDDEEFSDDEQYESYESYESDEDQNDEEAKNRTSSSSRLELALEIFGLVLWPS